MDILWMRRHRSARRLISIVVAAAMMTPAVGVAVAAATGTLLSPPPGEKVTSRNVEVSVGYNTQSDLKVTRLELWVDGRRVAVRSLVRPETRGVCSFWWDTSGFARGPHKLSVKIFAGEKLVTTVSGTCVIGEVGYDLRAPNVIFPDIKSGDVLKGTASIRMIVTDDSGEPAIVTLLVDNALKFLSNRKPYVYVLDTTKYADGVHELQTFAYDSAGNKSDPAVVKVTFRNGVEKPAAVALDTQTVPRTVPSSEDDGVGKLIPPLVESQARTTLPARAPEPDIRASKPAAAHPVARKPVEPTKSAGRPIRPLSAVTSRSEPVASEPSAKSTGAVPGHKPAPGAREPRLSAMAVEPVPAGPPPGLPVLEPAIESEPQSGPVAVQPRSNSLRIVGETFEQLSPAEPVPAPAEAELVLPKPVQPGSPGLRVAPALRSTSTKPVAATRADAVEPSVLSGLVNSSPKSVVVEESAPAARRTQVALNPMGRDPEAPRAPIPEAAAAAPKPVLTAMLPTLREGERSLSTSNGIIYPPPAQGDRKAVLEKRLLQAKGKIKLRDLVNELGGIVFWDSQTRTATAYVHNLKIEVKIGSSIVNVNGGSMRTNLVPTIANGRTIIDAALYAQACAFAERLSGSASAQTR